MGWLILSLFIFWAFCIGLLVGFWLGNSKEEK